MKTTHSLETLQTALAALEKLDAVDLVGTFREFEHSCSAGTYCALVLDPTDGSTATVNEASWSCSADEYFSESGTLSRETLISATRAHWSPCPDDGFEWDFTGDEYIWDGKNHDTWVRSDGDLEKLAAAKLREKIGDKLADAILPEAVAEDNALLALLALGWEEFSISETPVEGWVFEGSDDHDVREVEKQLEGLRESIREEIETIESA